MIQREAWYREAALDFAEVEFRGVRFETGHPVEFLFTRNLEAAPDMGSRYQQDIEISGMYVIGPSDRDQQEHLMRNLPEKFMVGTIRFDNPLVIAFNSGGKHTYDQASWKARLAEHYGATGQDLAEKVRADGYDGVVTVQGEETSEIVCLVPGCVSNV